MGGNGSDGERKRLSLSLFYLLVNNFSLRKDFLHTLSNRSRVEKVVYNVWFEGSSYTADKIN